MTASTKSLEGALRASKRRHRKVLRLIGLLWERNASMAEHALAEDERSGLLSEIFEREVTLARTVTKRRIERDLPKGRCEACGEVRPLYYPEAQVAWPHYWLCGDCLREADRRYDEESYWLELYRDDQQEEADDAILRHQDRAGHGW